MEEATELTYGRSPKSDAVQYIMIGQGVGPRPYRLPQVTIARPKRLSKQYYKYPRCYRYATHQSAPHPFTMSTQTNSEPVPEGPKLPQELLDMIIDESRDDNASLQQLSLVCHSFCQQARCHLFRIIRVDCKPSELYHHFGPPSSPKLSRATSDQFIEFIRLCESPHSIWSPGFFKELRIRWPVDDGLLTLLAPEELLHRTTANLDIPRTRDIFRGLDSLRILFAYAVTGHGNWHPTGALPCELFSIAFPSIRRLSLDDVQFSAIEDLWNILISVPLLEELKLLYGTFHNRSTTLENVRLTRSLPHLRSFSYRCGHVSGLRDFMQVFSRLPLSHLRRYEFGLADRDDFPVIPTLMTMAGSNGPAKQQWSFGFFPSSYEEGVYDFRNSEDLYFIADQLCLTQNPRISEINFKYDSFDHEDDYAWLLVQELLQRFVRRSSSKSNLESIVLPPFSVNQCSPGLDIFSIMERIDEILDDDVFSGLQELHFHPIRRPVDQAWPPVHETWPPVDETWPLDEKTRNRWGKFEPMLNDIEGRYLSRAVKRGIWRLHTVEG